MKNKNHAIISVDAEKHLKKFNMLLSYKSQQIRYRRNLHQHNKGHMMKADITLSGENLTAFLSDEDVCSCLRLPRAIRQDEEMMAPESERSE